MPAGILRAAGTFGRHLQRNVTFDVPDSESSSDESDFDPDPGEPQSKNAQEFYAPFPIDSADPLQWRRTPRKTHNVEWKPDHRPGYSEFNFHKGGAPGFQYLTMMQKPLDELLDETNRYGRLR